MVRRAASSTTDDSLKENSGLRSTTAIGKGKEVKRERGLRNGNSAVRRVQRDEEEMQDDNRGQLVEEEAADYSNEEDAQDEEEEEEDEGHGSPKGRKRARANTNGDSYPSGSNVKIERTRIVTLPRDDDGFIPGSLVRVQLRNFVTYDYVEFCPGPYLNMILGPNGTGKSSIACAICLGLNFPPSVLGRANDLNEFVKIGANDGHIEIEMKGPKGKPNLIIKRFLKASSKSSTFTLNGESATGREVAQKMSALNVQVSNLCSFLPQDRVAEFARMSPQQLLKETQKAAGDARLTGWHDTLISAGRELKVLQGSLDEDRKQHDNLEERNAMLERDVKRFKERQAIEQQIELLELVAPYRQYREASERYSETKKIRGALHDRVRTLKEANAPVEAFKNDLSRQCEELSRRRDAKKTSTKRKFAQLRTKWDDNEKLDSQVEECKNKLDGLKTREKSRLSDIQKTEKAISKFEEQLASPKQIGSVEAINEEIRALKNEYAYIQQQQSELQDRQRTSVDEEARHKASLESAKKSLQQLDDAEYRKLQSLQSWDKNCAEVVVWLRQNQNRFKMPVMEPPVLSVNVIEKRYNLAVENCFSNTQLKMFVMQCEEDYKLFNRLVCDTGEALGRPTNVSTWCRPNSEITAPPMSRETMREIGFDGYALDFVNYPEGLSTFLQADVQLHRIAVGTDARKIDQPRAMDACSRSGSARYIIGSVMNNVSRSRYGKQLTQNSTYECRQPSKLVTVNIDPSIQRKLQEDIEAANHELDQVAVQMAKLADDDRKIQAAQSTFKSKHDRLLQRKTDIATERTRLERLRLQLRSAQDKLTKLQGAPPVDVERNRYKASIIELAKQRIRNVRDYEALLRAAITEQTDATKFSLQSLQISANLAHLEELFKERDEKITEAMEKFNKAQKAFEVAKQEASDLHVVLKDKIREVKTEVRDKFKVMQASGEIDSRSFQAWAEDLTTQREKFELTTKTAAGVIDQYEQRKQAIEQLKAVIADKEEKVNKKERAIKSARDHWEPALTRLVDSVGERFSTAFDRIGCAGEIKISQHEDYDKWAIDILVKFRDSEKLQLLTGERQSGGERSLTTIMYLMSLTAEARTPFSLVDEINQGMDARAERAVHNSLVDVTCKAESGQYFLITPKLLPDLNYHERMKVLCVNNGEWLPEDVSRGDMMSMIDTYVRITRRGSHSAA